VVLNKFYSGHTHTHKQEKHTNENIFKSTVDESQSSVCVWWVRKANSQSLNTSCGAVCLLVRAGERNKVVNSQHSGHFSSDRVSATEKDFQHKLQKKVYSLGI
jgi:hypothetical protein